MLSTLSIWHIVQWFANYLSQSSGRTLSTPSVPSCQVMVNFCSLPVSELPLSLYNFALFRKFCLN